MIESCREPRSTARVFFRSLFSAAPLWGLAGGQRAPWARANAEAPESFLKPVTLSRTGSEDVRERVSAGSRMPQTRPGKEVRMSGFFGKRVVRLMAVLG